MSIILPSGCDSFLRAVLDEERVFGEHGFCERLFPLPTVWIEHPFDVKPNVIFRPRISHVAI